MCTTDAHDVVVGSAMVGGAMVGGAVVVGAAEDAPTVELDPSREVAGAGADDELEVSAHAVTASRLGRAQEHRE